jgi:hypothetical protein
MIALRKPFLVVGFAESNKFRQTGYSKRAHLHLTAVYAESLTRLRPFETFEPVKHERSAS